MSHPIIDDDLEVQLEFAIALLNTARGNVEFNRDIVVNYGSRANMNSQDLAGRQIGEVQAVLKLILAQTYGE